MDATIRVCVKQVCESPAAFSLSFDYGERTVWLDDLIESGSRAFDFCVRHAERFSAPLGWQLLDRRSDTPPRFATCEEPVPPRRVPGPRPVPVPLEEHPSGPVDLAAGAEPADVTARLAEIEAHLDLMAEDAFGEPLDEGAPPPPHPPPATGDVVLPDDLAHDLSSDLTEEIHIEVFGEAGAAWDVDGDTSVQPGP